MSAKHNEVALIFHHPFHNTNEVSILDTIFTSDWVKYNDI